MSDTLLFGSVGEEGRCETEESRAIRAPIVIVDKADRQASVVHSRPLGVSKKGRTFQFGETRASTSHGTRTARRTNDAEPTVDRGGAADSEPIEPWVTLSGAPPSLFGDVVYDVLTSPWAEDVSQSSIGLMLKGRLESTTAGSATLFGEWTGPGASIAAELSKGEFNAEAAETHTSRDLQRQGTKTQRRKSEVGDSSLGVSASLRLTPPSAPKSDDEIFFITDDK